LRPDLHRMPDEPRLLEIVNEIQSGLAALPRPAEIPQHWEPMHGDFTPWNLRQQRNGNLFLIDWEDAGWAPPGADQVYYRGAERVLGRDSVVPAYSESRNYWIQRLQERRISVLAAGDPDADFVSLLSQELG